MKLFINETACAAEAYAGEKTLKEVIASIEKSVLPKSHVITTVKLNGVVLSLEEEREIAQNYPTARIESLEILSAEPRELILEGVQASPAVLEELIDKTGLVIEKLRRGEVNQGIDIFQSCLEWLLWFNEILTLISKVTKIDYTQVELAGKNVAALNGQLLNVYTDIIASQQKNDWINLSDLLEYELIPLLKTWRDLTPDFLAYLKKRLEEVN